MISISKYVGYRNSTWRRVIASRNTLAGQVGLEGPRLADARHAWKPGPECRSAPATSRLRPTTSCYRHPQRSDIKRSPHRATHHPLMSSPSKQSPFSHWFHKHTVIKHPWSARRAATWRRPAISLSLPPHGGSAPRAPPRRLAAAPRNVHDVYVHRCHFVLIISLDVNFDRNGSMDFSKTLNVSRNVKSLKLHEEIKGSGVAQLVL